MPFKDPAPATPETLRVLVVDDHALLSETLADALAHDGRMVVDTVSDLQGALDAVARNGPYGVVLLDYDLPGAQGLDGLHSLMEANGGKVALFSGVVGWAVAERALAAGAAGFLPKTLPLKVVAQAVGLIAAGGVYAPADYMAQGRAGAAGAGTLRARELSVLACLAKGMSNRQIGEELGLEEAIVKATMRSICAKLGAANRTQALIAARNAGLV